MKENYAENKERVYEIYGIPPEERRKYSIHHIIFKNDVRQQPGIWKGFKVNKLSNLCPLRRWDHRELHRKVAEMENDNGHSRNGLHRRKKGRR